MDLFVVLELLPNWPYFSMPRSSHIRRKMMRSIVRWTEIYLTLIEGWIS